MSGPRKRRRERLERDIERDVRQSQAPPPSFGMYYVLNLDTKQKTSGLGLPQAMALWRKTPRAMVFPLKFNSNENTQGRNGQV
jgi:hypothetical protein